MSERFAWVDSHEMFSLILARDAEHEELAQALTGDTAERLESVDSWPSRVDAVKFVTGENDGWAFALAFSSGLLPDVALDSVARRWDVVSVWFDIHANSEFRSYQDGAIVRRCSVIGHAFEPADGDALPEEQGLFVDNVEWDERSDGLELVARVTKTEPSESWWTTASRAWAAAARF
jgi:hypothetical protein